MVTITDSTFRHTIYKTVYDILSPALASSIISPNPALYGGFPDWNDVSFPVVIIEPVEGDEDEHTIDSSGSTSTKFIRLRVHVFSTKNAHLDVLADYISWIVREVDFDGAFQTGTTDTNAYLEASGQKIKGKTLTFMFKRR